MKREDFRGMNTGEKREGEDSHKVETEEVLLPSRFN
jgi:hypothetical protein